MLLVAVGSHAVRPTHRLEQFYLICTHLLTILGLSRLMLPQNNVYHRSDGEKLVIIARDG